MQFASRVRTRCLCLCWHQGKRDSPHMGGDPGPQWSGHILGATHRATVREGGREGGRADCHIQPSFALLCAATCIQSLTQTGRPAPPCLSRYIPTPRLGVSSATSPSMPTSSHLTPLRRAGLTCATLPCGRP